LTRAVHQRLHGNTDEYFARYTHRQQAMGLTGKRVNVWIEDKQQDVRWELSQLRQRRYRTKGRLLCETHSSKCTSLFIECRTRHLSQSVSTCRDVNMTSRLKDEAKNQGLSTLTAFIMQRTQIISRGQVLFEFCSLMLFYACVAEVSIT